MLLFETKYNIDTNDQDTSDQEKSKTLNIFDIMISPDRIWEQKVYFWNNSLDADIYWHNKINPIRLFQ